MTKLFVGNLAWTLSEDELREAFAAFGEVDSARIVVDFETERPRGFGFVSMTNQDEADKAIAALNGAELKGRPLRCRHAFDRPMRPF